jgi:hypothetical protein
MTTKTAVAPKPAGLSDEIRLVLSANNDWLTTNELLEQCQLAENIQDVARACWQMWKSGGLFREQRDGRYVYKLNHEHRGTRERASTASIRRAVARPAEDAPAAAPEVPAASPPEPPKVQHQHPLSKGRLERAASTPSMMLSTYLTHVEADLEEAFKTAAERRIDHGLLLVLHDVQRQVGRAVTEFKRASL